MRASGVKRPHAGSSPARNEFAYKSILGLSQSGRRDPVSAGAKVSVVSNPLLGLPSRVPLYGYGACRQAVKTSGCDSDIRGFESHQAPQHGYVA